MRNWEIFISYVVKHVIREGFIVVRKLCCVVLVKALHWSHTLIAMLTIMLVNHHQERGGSGKKLR